MKSATNMLKIGWASTDITPDQPVLIAGQFQARVSEGVLDPVTATALVLEAPGGGCVTAMVSCDLVAISDPLRLAVRERVYAAVPEIAPISILLNATHTHAAPEVRTRFFHTDRTQGEEAGDDSICGVVLTELGVMDPRAYTDWAAGRIAEAVVRAWENRAPGGVAFGLGYAVVGRNRRLSYRDGRSAMYGRSDVPDFSHVEGYEDPSVNILGTYDAEDRLTGLVVNVACPSQVSEKSYVISADFWHEVRVALRRELGADLNILPQCGAAGDQSPHILVNRRAEKQRLVQRGWIETPDVELHEYPGTVALRRELADRITGAVLPLLPGMKQSIDRAPRFEHGPVTLDITHRVLTEADVEEALEEAAHVQQKYEALREEFAAHPEKKQAPRWYVGITFAYRRMCWFQGVKERFERQQRQPRQPVELHMLRLGDVAFATNPFELYLDYGVQIRERSPALMTFVVNLAGVGSYLPSERAVAGKSYGAIPASTPIGPEGGRELVEQTLDTLHRFWT